MSEAAEIKHCLNCAHPFDVKKWREVYDTKLRAERQKHYEQQVLLDRRRSAGLCISCGSGEKKYSRTSGAHGSGLNASNIVKCAKCNHLISVS